MLSQEISFILIVKEHLFIHHYYKTEKRREFMNKTELIIAIADKAEITKKDAADALNAFIDIVSEELEKGESVQLIGFGTFDVSKRAARTGRNPQTGEEMKIPATKAPKFKAGKALKEVVNSGKK